LAFLPDRSISLVYSWDSMVHFERSVVAQHVQEFARVMQPGAWGFVHHSNQGTISDDPDIERAPHLRSNLTADLFGAYCREHGLERTNFLVFDWGGVANTDCISLFFEPFEGRGFATWRARTRQATHGRSGCRLAAERHRAHASEIVPELASRIARLPLAQRMPDSDSPAKSATRTAERRGSPFSDGYPRGPCRFRPPPTPSRIPLLRVIR